MTMPRTNTIGGPGTTALGGEPVDREVPYISFSAVVGRNSRFKDLTEEQMDEVGGVEYRALRALLYIVAAVSEAFPFRQGWHSSALVLLPGAVLGWYYHLAVYRRRRQIQLCLPGSATRGVDRLVFDVPVRLGVFEYWNESGGSEHAAVPDCVPGNLP